MGTVLDDNNNLIEYAGVYYHIASLWARELGIELLLSEERIKTPVVNPSL